MTKAWNNLQQGHCQCTRFGRLARIAYCVQFIWKRIAYRPFGSPDPVDHDTVRVFRVFPSKSSLSLLGSWGIPSEASPIPLRIISEYYPSHIRVISESYSSQYPPLPAVRPWNGQTRSQKPPSGKPGEVFAVGEGAGVREKENRNK